MDNHYSLRCRNRLHCFKGASAVNAIIYPHPNLFASQLELLCLRYRLRLKHVGFGRFVLERL